ncbi:MAG: THUMP domain-containing class I SAM-dependent RNA methyltransferase [Balneolaceae bacterium]
MNFDKKSTVRITCPIGLSRLLKKETEELGFTPLVTEETGIELQASLNECMVLNFRLRTAHRVHYLLGQKKINNEQALYEWANSFPWEEIIPQEGFFSVTSRISHPSITNDQFANVRVKDAVVDRMRAKTGSRPDSGPDLTGTVLFVYWDQDVARLFLDTSGESLSRRNYRTRDVAAPMQETLAAAIIKTTKWEPGWHMINPMAGGGTLAIEAAMIATNRAPAMLRHQFGFMHLIGYDESVYQSIRESAKKAAQASINSKIIVTDNSPTALLAAKKNAETAGVHHLMEFETCDVADTPVPEGDGIIVVNPPYGIRLDSRDDLRPLYKKIGDFFKSEGAGKWGYVFTGNQALGKKVGLRTSSKTTFFNTTIECRLLEYELYSGRK